MVLSALEAIVSIFLIIGVGYALAAGKIITPQVGHALSRIIMTVALPCTILYNFQEEFSKQQLSELGVLLLVCFIALFICIVVGGLWAKAVPKTRRGLFTLVFTFSNAAYIGFPVIETIYGTEGMPYAIVFFAASCILTNIFSFVMIRRDSDVIRHKEEKMSLKDIILKLMTPVVFSLVLSIALLLLEIRLPGFILIATKYVGELTSPLALIFTGSVIYSIGFKNMRYERGIGEMMAGRFLITPAIILGIGLLMGVSGLALRVVVLQMALSCMVQPVVMAQMYGADTAFATKSVVYSTALSLITIPVTVVILNLII